VVFTDNGPQSLEDLLKSHPDTKDVFMEEGQDDELMLRDELLGQSILPRLSKRRCSEQFSQSRTVCMGTKEI